VFLKRVELPEAWAIGLGRAGKIDAEGYRRRRGSATGKILACMDIFVSIFIEPYHHKEHV
jgi:hypothetical protein